MRNLTLATSVALLTTTGIAHSGGLAPAVEEKAPLVVTPVEPGSSASPYLVPLLLLGLVAAANSASGSGSSSSGSTVQGSDERLKTDIVRVGAAHNGLPLYHFRYIGDDTVREGVMAQDVLNHTPSAVVMMESGFMGVDYGALGLSMRVVD